MVFNGDPTTRPSPAVVSSWHYPNQCDAALQRVRPLVNKFIIDVVGACPRVNAAMVLSVPSTYGTPDEGDPVGAIHCSFVLQSLVNQQNGWVWPIAFGYDEYRVAAALRKRVVLPPGNSPSSVSSGPRIYLFQEDDTLDLDECSYVMSGVWADIVTYVSYNAQTEASSDPLLRDSPSSDSVVSFSSPRPNIVNIPHPFEWATIVPGPIREGTSDFYLPSELFAIAGMTQQDQLRYSSSHRRKTRPPPAIAAVAAADANLGGAEGVLLNMAAPAPSKYRIVWRGVTTGVRHPSYQFADRYRAIAVLQKEQLRRTLETAKAKDMLASRWSDAAARGEGSPLATLTAQQVTALSKEAFPLLAFADVCFTRLVQDVKVSALGVVVRPNRAFHQHRDLDEGGALDVPTATSVLGAARDVHGSYFVISDNASAPATPRSRAVSVNFNGKGVCKSQTPEALLRKGMIHLDVDGNGNAWEGLRWKLCAGSAIIKVSSSRHYHQWYYDKLVNGTHLIVVNGDTIERDLVPTVDALSRDEALVKRLSRNALAFCEQYLKEDAAKRYYLGAFS